jgi:hypothetical protein
MRDLNNQERNAIETVAKRFSAAWEKSSDLPDAHIVVAGNPVAVQIAPLKWRRTRAVNAAKPRLRFDKVATRLIERLQAALDETVPDGITVLLTITAPIRLASKTTTALEGKIRTLFERESASRDEKITIHENRIQIRVLTELSKQVPKMIGFVHNPDSDPLLLLNTTSELLELISTDVGFQAKRLAGERWLVVIGEENISFLELYRCICSQLRRVTDFKKILMVFGDGRVEMLMG